MPNLQQINALKEKYGSYNRIGKSELLALSESFSSPSYVINNKFTQRGLNTNPIDFFEQQKSADVVTLFIDITGFSLKCKSLNNQQLSSYLDSYYDIVIPIIYRHGGEVEKIIGDGIICLFGEPFLRDSKETLFEKADKCAKDVIIQLKGSDKEVKIAINDGIIMYYKNKTLNYPEYTMIGKPLTELFRLESVAQNNSISFYHTSPYDYKTYTITGIYSLSFGTTASAWTKGSLVGITLQGVNCSFIKHFECTYRT